MLRKVLSFVLLIAVLLSAASCDLAVEPGSGDPFEKGESRQSEVSQTEYSEILLPDPESSEPERSREEPPAESSEEQQKVWPKPVCTNPFVKAPEVEDDPHLPIRSVHNSKKNTVEVFGNIDANDAGVAQALADINSWLGGYNKKISFFAYTLDGTGAVAYNCEDTFFSACTIKTAFIFYCCLAIDQGLADRNTVMYYQECYYHKGSGDIRMTDYGTPYTLETLIYKALNISDNVAYEMLTAYFGHEGYNKFMKDIGIPNLTLGSGLWTRQMNPKDLCTVWRELYFYFESGSPMSQVYKKACTNTKFNYCALYLGLPYSHKSGDNFAPNEVYNDGALIWADRPFVVSFLTVSEGKAEDEKVVNTISKIIYDSMMKPVFPPKEQPPKESTDEQGEL